MANDDNHDSDDLQRRLDALADTPQGNPGAAAGQAGGNAPRGGGRGARGAGGRAGRGGAGHGRGRGGPRGGAAGHQQQQQQQQQQGQMMGGYGTYPSAMVGGYGTYPSAMVGGYGGYGMMAPSPLPMTMMGMPPYPQQPYFPQQQQGAAGDQHAQRMLEREQAHRHEMDRARAAGRRDRSRSRSPGRSRRDEDRHRRRRSPVGTRAGAADSAGRYDAAAPPCNECLRTGAPDHVAYSHATVDCRNLQARARHSLRRNAARVTGVAQPAQIEAAPTGQLRIEGPGTEESADARQVRRLLESEASDHPGETLLQVARRVRTTWRRSLVQRAEGTSEFVGLSVVSGALGILDGLIESLER